MPAVVQLATGRILLDVHHVEREMDRKIARLVQPVKVVNQLVLQVVLLVPIVEAATSNAQRDVKVVIQPVLAVVKQGAIQAVKCVVKAARVAVIRAVTEIAKVIVAMLAAPAVQAVAKVVAVAVIQVVRAGVKQDVLHVTVVREAVVLVQAVLHVQAVPVAVVVNAWDVKEPVL